MKKALALIVILALTLQAVPASAFAPSAMPDSDPISKGTINKVTYLRWGKSELYPTLALVGPGETFDVYEYDKNWVMVLYDTYVKQGTSGSPQSFYCYVKRPDITCDPKLEGDASDKADTGPGKRPGKKPKPQPTPGSSAAATPEPSAQGTAEPEPTVEEQEEYDWIIRTPGMCNVTVHVEQMDFTCSFALMAQKVGGTAPSSDPAFNHNMHTPYAATACFGMVASTQSLVNNIGMSGVWSGSGGIEITGQSAGTTFFIDTGAEDFALVNFTLNLDATATLNPKITDGNITADAGTTTVNMPFPLPVQLKKVGNGYKFVLPGMKPGGGDLEFPAVLEKTFSDPDYWDKQARDADRRRKEADKLIKQLLDKIKKQMQDELAKQQETGKDGQASTDPMTARDDSGNDVPLAPLVTPDPLAPLVTDEPLAPLVTEDPLAPLVTEDPLAPLVPTPDENVIDFPAHG
jgi:hypothetical protein